MQQLLGEASKRSTGGQPVPVVKPRRAHEKSRNGCLRCKKQRKKCDETKPRCSRCDVHGYFCQYPNDDDYQSFKNSIASKNRQSPSNQDGIDSQFASLTIPADTWSERSSRRSVSNTSATASPRHIDTPSTTNNLLPSPPPVLDATELALLSHYLSHTSRTIPVDRVDRYALQIGIPNLAFQSKPVMSSLLALSAVGKCNSLINSHVDPLDRLADICELLDFAADHHKASLRQIQTVIQSPAHHEYVLANSPLMVLYCTADHAIRVHLARTAKLRGTSLPENLLPTQSQWISLIRAAHLAYISLSNNINDQAEEGPVIQVDAPPEVQEHTSVLSSLRTEMDGYVPEHGPSEGTRKMLLPIIEATYHSALARLRVKATSISLADLMESEGEGLHPWQQQSYNTFEADLRTTITALDILSEVANDVFSSLDGGFLDEQLHDSVEEKEGIPAVDRLRHISPWLRDYSARVVSATPTRQIRRIIVIFLNQVPLDYLNSIQTILDLMPVEPTYSQNYALPEEEQFKPSIVYQLAMDIFTHWLVFAMLLDGVWWIGGTGEWELERAVSFMRAHGWVDAPSEGGERWWPESMSNVKKELAEHV